MAGISPEDMADLLAIQRADPDGWATEAPPTEEQYAAFERWVVQHFGQAMLDRYRRSGWGERSDV